MSSRRFSLLMVNSLIRFLIKDSSHGIVDSIKFCNALKTFSTSAERLDFQSFGPYHGDDFLNYQPSHDKFYPASQNGTNSGQLPNGQCLDNVNQAHASGFCGRRLVNDQKNLHQHWAYSEGLKNEIGDKSREHIFEHKNDSPERFYGGIDQNLDGPILNNNVFQNNLVGQRDGNTIPVMETAEASGSIPYKGTLEELDNFCTEGKVKEAVEILGLLEKQHIPVDLHRYVNLMRQCGQAKALEEAKITHQHVLKYLSPLKVSTYNKILEMYSKCGSMDDAFEVFNNMPKRNLTTWDTMITWLAKNELAEDSIDLFTQFKKLGLKPDGKMFIGVFTACSMVGDIDEGMLHFESMSKSYGIVPSMTHYVSVVDMFGSIGHLDEAFQFVENMPVEPSADVWETLMNHCRIHGNMELGDLCAELVEKLDPSRLNEQSKAGLVPVKPSDLAKEKEKKKLANQNLLEVRSRVHEYRAGDTSHPDSDKIYALLRGLRSQMKELGYIPETRFVLHDIDQEWKEEALFAHSERLAAAQGLLTSPARSDLRIIKNLRFCGDCHNVFKIISKIVGRVLIIRDAKRFHHFSNGVCSCGDYW